MTRADAKRAAKWARKINGPEHHYRVYWCHYCTYWHFGHSAFYDAYTPGAWRPQDIPMTTTQQQPKATRPRYVIGIDPGAHTGCGVWDRVERRLIDVRTGNFWTVIEHVTATYPTHETVIVIEDPNLNPSMHAGTLKGAAGVRAALRIAQNVGENKAEARLLIEGFERAGYAVEPFKPTRSKPTEDHFRRVTGYEGRTSEHARDAAMFVYGR